LERSCESSNSGGLSEVNFREFQAFAMLATRMRWQRTLLENFKGRQTLKNLNALSVAKKFDTKHFTLYVDFIREAHKIFEKRKSY
jgi:hypothetical protein